MNAATTLRLVQHRWSSALQHSSNLLAAWGGTCWASEAFQAAQTLNMVSVPLLSHAGQVVSQIFPRLIVVCSSCLRICQSTLPKVTKKGGT